MTSMTNYLENKLIDWLFRGKAFTPPATWYVGLFTAAPSDTGGGTEVSGGSYARASLASSTANWAATDGATSTADPSAGTGGTTSNNSAVAFPAPTADWGVITHFGLFDASTSGNLLFAAALTASKTVNNGDAAPTFATSALTVQLDN